MAKCKACGAFIRFVRIGGKFMPVNPEPLYVEVPGGPEVIVTEDGRVSRGVRMTSPPPAGAKYGYISHFATCTDPDKFRRKGKEI